MEKRAKKKRKLSLPTHHPSFLQSSLYLVANLPMSIYNFKSLSSSNLISGFLLLQNNPPNPWHLRPFEGLKYTNKCHRIKMTNIWELSDFFFSLPTAEWPGFLLFSCFFSFFFWEESFQCPVHNCLFGRYNLGQEGEWTWVSTCAQPITWWGRRLPRTAE